MSSPPKKKPLIVKSLGAPPQLKKILSSCGWEIHDAATRAPFECDVIWNISRPDSDSLAQVPRGVFYNRIPGTNQLSLKDNLQRFLITQLERYGEEVYAFFPRGWILPGHVDIVRKRIEERKEIFISKPSHGSGGFQIEILRHPADLDVIMKRLEKTKLTAVLQQYISPPRTVGGVKFDLRVYVFVSSVNPLRIWVYKDGLARFCSHKYQTDDLKDRYAHLTNTAVNQNAVGSYSPEAVEAREALEGIFGPPDPEGPPKWAITKLFERLEVEGVDPEETWRQIYRIVNLCIIPVILNNVYTQQCSVFEFYGFDFLLDPDNKVYLLEVNQNPSIDLSFKLDEDIKIPMVSTMVDILLQDSKEDKVGNYQLIFDSENPDLRGPYEFLYEN